MHAFFEPRGDRLHATPLTRGPWDDRFQHGGPPSAMLARAIRTFAGEAEYALARLSVTFLKAVPIAPVTVRVRIEHDGRATQRLSAVLEADGVEVLVGTGLRVRRSATEENLPDEGPESAWPAPESLEPFVFPFFHHDIGYHRAVDLRLARGAFGTTPVRYWARPTVPLVAGEPTAPREAVVLLADAQSGMGLPLPPERFTFVNPDLTVSFARTPVGPWTGLDIRSIAGAEGFGLAQSRLSDERGLFGGCSQTLVIRAR